MKRIQLFLAFGFMLFSFLFISSCKKDAEIIEPTPNDPNAVYINYATVPFQKLSEYKFFIGDIKLQQPNDRVIPYLTASPLFTDYASKKRFIWLPHGKKATYSADGDILDLPVGAVLIKNFYYENFEPIGTTHILETRIMIRKSTGWIFAEYIWNDEQTEAFLNMGGSYKEISFTHNGELKSTNYRFPSSGECLVCHKENGQPMPIGIKPQNLNFDYNYEDGMQNQLTKLISLGYLTNNLPAEIVSTVDYSDASKPLDLRFRSYIDANCAHCHREGSHCDYRPMKLAFKETSDPLNIGLCVEPDEFINTALTYIITPSNINRSMMYYRLNTNQENVRMPLLGRTLIHQEGVDLLEEWINSKTDCN